MNLFRRDEAREQAGEVLTTLREKCAFKSLPVPTARSLDAHRADLEADWTSMLRHQLPELPPFESFWSVIPEFFQWLDGSAMRPRLAPHRLAIGELVRPSTGGFLALGLSGRPLETIRFAGANHLCVDLDYRDESGRRPTRRIEAYSLRRTDSGDVLLHAERADGSGHRSYRVDRIVAATVTSQAFVPKWRIELSPGRSPSSAIPRSPGTPLPRPRRRR